MTCLINEGDVAEGSMDVFNISELALRAFEVGDKLIDSMEKF